MRKLIILITTLLFFSYNLALTSTQNFTANDYKQFFLGLENYPGFIPIDNQTSLFYWFFPSLDQSADTPLIVWIDGGPGTSDEFGIFYQNGPFRINTSDYSLYQNPYSWVNVANVLYLDQPRGTGFSISQTVNTNEYQVADDFYTFFVKFLDEYPQYKGRKLMISGWSYGGQMVPEIAAKLQNMSTQNPDINLQYVAIGNGWLSTYYIYTTQPEYAFKNNLINESLYTQLQAKVPICQYLINKANSDRSNETMYLEAMGYCELNIWYPIIAKTVPTNYQYFVDDPNFNAWNIQQPCVGPPNCGFGEMSGNLTVLLNSSKLVQSYLGVENLIQYWTFWNGTVETSLTKTSILDQQQEKINYLLNNSVQILMYEGVDDFVCNWMGILQALESMQWSGSKSFQNQTFSPYSINNQQYGEYISADNLTFLKIFNAGHNVIVDQPMAALNFITKFINGWNNQNSQKYSEAEYDEFFLNLENYPGFIPIDNNTDLFYWFFPSLNQQQDTPLIVWIDGGPGTSDEFGIFYQNGPYRINGTDYTLFENPYSWINVANVLYLDQPRGTGFSVSQTVNTYEYQVADDFYAFFTKFLDLYPQFKGRPVMISGWSYGGQMVPEIAAYLQQQSSNNPDINLKYVAIGNGWLSSYHFFSTQPEYAYQNNLINESLYNQLQQKVPTCQYLINQANANRTNQSLYTQALGYCVFNIWYAIIAKTIPSDYAYFVPDPNFNAWEIKQPCIDPPLCGFGPNQTILTNFINNTQIFQEYLGVEEIAKYWTQMNSTVEFALQKLSVLDEQQEKINYLLNNSVQVLIYNGVDDFVCNWMGDLSALESMNWSGLALFKNETFQPFIIEDYQYGEYIQNENLVFLKVFNAGHNVIIQHPMPALNMITRFINGWSQCQTNEILNGENKCVDCSDVYGPFCDQCNQYTCTSCVGGRTYGLSKFQPFYQVCQS